MKGKRLFTVHFYSFSINFSQVKIWRETLQKRKEKEKFLTFKEILR